MAGPEVSFIRRRGFTVFLCYPPFTLEFVILQIDFDSVYTMNKDLFKAPKPSRGSQDSANSVVSLSQKYAKASRNAANRLAQDRRTVVTPRNKVCVRSWAMIVCAYDTPYPKERVWHLSLIKRHAKTHTPCTSGRG